MSAKDANRNTWYPGLLVGEADFEEHQDNIEQGLKTRSKDQIGWGLIGSSGSLALASSPADLISHIAAAKMITPDGFGVEWTTTQDIDVSQATAGTLQGSTAAVTAGTKRYIVTSVTHEYNDTEPRTDDLGATKYYRRVSQPVFYVWMTAEVPSADDPLVSTPLRNLITQMIAANHAPIGLCQRAQGSSAIDNANMDEIARTIRPYGEDADHGDQLVQHLLGAGGLGLPMTLTVDGTIAITPEAVVGQPGKITLTGGEQIAFGIAGNKGAPNLYDSDDYRNRVLVKEIPAAEEINFPAEDTTYVVRCYVDPLSHDLVFYKGTGDFPNDSSIANDAHGTDGGIQQGFLPTWIDLPLAVVTTGANGTVPIVDLTVQNDWMSKLAYIQNQALRAANSPTNDDIAGLLTEFVALDQPYVNVAKSLEFLEDIGGLNLRIYQLSIYRGHADYTTDIPPGVTPSQDVALTDNAINLVYADLTANPPDFKAVDISAGGGLTANPQHVVLGVVRTSGASIVEIVHAPMDRATAMIERVRTSYIHVPNDNDILVGPTDARQLIGRKAGAFAQQSTVYRAPFITDLDPTNSLNWVDNTIDGGAGWRYIYADPGGQHFSDVNLCKFKLDGTAPNYLGRHPSDANLLYIGCYYYENPGHRKMYKSGDLVVQEAVNVLAAGAAAAGTAIPLGVAIPPTAYSVILSVFSDLGGVGATLTTIFHRLIGDGEFNRIQFTGAASEQHTVNFIEVPVEYNGGAPQIHYQHTVGGGGTNTIDARVVGFRERSFGNANGGEAMKVVY